MSQLLPETMKKIAIVKRCRRISIPGFTYAAVLAMLTVVFPCTDTRGQGAGEPNNTDGERVGLLQKCCEMDVKFFKTDGVTEIQRANTNEFFTIKASVEGDNCRAKWFYQNDCDESFERIEDEGSDRPSFKHLAGKWGPVIYRSRVECNEDYDCADGVVFPVLDWGIWFYGDEGRLKKFRKGGDFDGYYDPAKPSVLFIHGLRQGAASNDLRQDFVFSRLEGNPQTGQNEIVDEDLPALWRSKGFNFVVFNWTQFADENSLRLVEDKIWQADRVRWRDPLGRTISENFPSGRNIGDLIYESFLNWNPGSSVRIVGHGVGAQLAVELANRLSAANRTGKIQRLVLLNPYWSRESKPYGLGPDVTLPGQAITRTARRSLRDMASLYKKNVLVETYRNLYFGRNENLLYHGDDNDSIKAITAYADLKPAWQQRVLNIPPELNNFLQANDKRLHEAIYLWYLRSIDFPILPSLVDSERPKDENGRRYPLVEEGCNWQNRVAIGLTARTAFQASLNLQRSKKFSRQITGFETIATEDDSLVLEHFCSCIIDTARNTRSRGLVTTHDLAYREYAKCNDQVLLVRNAAAGTERHTAALLTTSPDASRTESTPTYLPNPYLDLPALSAREDLGCGASNGLVSIHPDSRKARLMVDREIEHAPGLEAITREYAHFVFNVLLPRGLYVYPMPRFEDERWYQTYKDMLAHKKIEGNWKIFKDDCYVVKDTLGNILFNDYRLHGIYDEDGRAVIGEEDVPNGINTIINRQTSSNGFNPFGNDGDIRPDIRDNPGIQLLQNGIHDQWEDRNSWIVAGGEMGPQANVTVYWPNGTVSGIYVDSIAQQKRFYQCLDMDWESLYPDNPVDETNLYAARDGGVDETSLNIGGYPALHKRPLDPGRPTGEQRNYWEGPDQGGYYNFKAQQVLQDRARFSCSEVIGGGSVFLKATYTITGQTPGITDLEEQIAADIGLHPHHFVRYAKFASDYDIIVGIRNSNQAAAQWLDEMYAGGKYRPKPLNIKAKSLQARAYSGFCAEGVSDCGTGLARFLGPGKAITNDVDCTVCDPGCGELAGLAAFDPRTDRGRRLIDPNQEFNSAPQFDCKSNTDFELLYARGLGSKMMKEGLYVYPIPYFANKYQQTFEVSDITDLTGQGLVIGSKYTDQLAKPVYVLLADESGNSPLQITDRDALGAPILFGFNGGGQFTLDQLANTPTGVYAHVYERDPSQPGVPLSFLWKKPLHVIPPEHTTQNSVYKVDDDEYPVWLDNNQISLPAGHPANQFVNFDYNFLDPVFEPGNIKGTIPTTASDPGWNPGGSWNAQSWVAVYYEILHRYFADLDDPYDVDNWKTNTIYAHSCYTIKDAQGNRYFSDYDGHGYYISQSHPQPLQRGNRWYPSWVLQDENVEPIDIDRLANDDREYARELLNHFLMKDFPWKAASDIPADQLEVYNNLKSYYTNSGVDVTIPLGQLPITGGVDPNLVKTRPWDVVQHGPQDEWYERNNYGIAEVNMGPQGNFTLWVPELRDDGQKVVRVYSMDPGRSTYNQERLYECLNLNFQSYFPQAFYTRSFLHPLGTSIMKTAFASRGGFDRFPCHYWSDGGGDGCQFTWNMSGIVDGASSEPNQQLKQYDLAFQALRLDPSLPFETLPDPDIEIDDPISCEVPVNECYSLEELRSLSREELFDINFALADLYDNDDGIPPGSDQQKRLAYTLDEFLGQEFDPSMNNTANTECIPGYYSRYVIGENPDLPDDDPDKYVILITHPYSEEDVTVRIDGTPEEEFIRDKAENYFFLLSAMCYEEVDDGWISMAEWHKLDSTLSGPGFSIRMTNRNFGGLGRITAGGEFLDEALQAADYLELKAPVIQAAGYSISGIYGPNFPTPGYDGNSTLTLRQMKAGLWDFDADPFDQLQRKPYYNQAPYERVRSEVTFDANGLILDEEGQPLDLGEVTSYLQDCMGRLYIARAGYIYHSELLGGAALASAGDIKVEEGRPVFIDNGSGHYEPPCEFLDLPLSLLASNGHSFEEKYPRPPRGICQSWYCNTISLEANFDGIPVTFGPGENDPDTLVRRMFIPGEVVVTAGERPAGSQVKLAIFGPGQRREPNELFYQPDPFNTTRYVLSPGQALNAGDSVLYNMINLSVKVIYGGTKDGTVEMKIENCPDDEANECYTLDELRSFSREELAGIDSDLGALYDVDDGIPPGAQQKRLAYTLEEFLALEFDPTGFNTANTECISGYYSRYFIGQNPDLPAGDPNREMILITHPYTEADATLAEEDGAMQDKTRYYGDVLRAMCYEKVDDGWISLAEWYKLDPDQPVAELSLRMTNHNFSNKGRITPKGEYLVRNTDAYNFLTSQAQQIAEAGYGISELYGSNFPTPGYEGNSSYSLRAMVPRYWELDADPNFANVVDYYQSPSRRAPFEVTLGNNGLIRDENGDIVDVPMVDYVMDCMGRLYIAKSSISFHSQYLGGGAVASAGRVSVRGGKPTFIDLFSGHYKPPSCEFLEQPIELLENAGTPFEEAYLTVREGTEGEICQAWYCNTISTRANFDGVPKSFGPRDDPRALYRKMMVPGKVNVINGTRPAGSQVMLTLRGGGNVNELIYEPDPADPAAYTLALGQGYNRGDTALYKNFVLKVIDGGSDLGIVEATIQNCPAEPDPGCYTLGQLRSLSRDELSQIDSDLGELYDNDDGVPVVDQQKRLAYTLEEFLLQEFEPSNFNTANTECIPGYYSRYAIGENPDLPESDPDRLIILISHPYTEEDVAVRNDGLPGQRFVQDKTDNYFALLEAMCYEPMDSGWVSLAQWYKLDPDLPEPGFAFRMTNSNFYETGRITTAGEYLAQGTSADNYLVRKTQAIGSFGYDISKILGPNFPTPGYEANDQYTLKQMLTGFWTLDAELIGDSPYIQAPFDRELLEVTFSDEGLVLDENGEPVNVDNVSYAQDCMGRFYIAKDELFSHSQFTGGGALASAGQIIVEEGEPIFVDLFSGHYEHACEFLDVPLALLVSQGYTFEEKYPEPLEEVCQAWHCNTISIEASFDGTPGNFGPGSSPIAPYRRMFVPERVSVTGGVRPPGSQVRLTTFGWEMIYELFYEPVPGDPTAYSLAPGQWLNVGDTVIFSSLSLVVLNGGTGTGAVTAAIENCPTDPGADCYTLEELRSLSRDDLSQVDSDLGELYDNDDGIPIVTQQKRLVYTLDEFLGLEFNAPDFNTANTECIPGYYARYVIGENHDLLGDDPDRLILLISHPYTEEDVAVRNDGSLEEEFIKDKTIHYEALLNAMCYEKVDAGWISLAEWYQLDPDLYTPGFTLRMTNRNFAELGRITSSGERLLEDTPASDYLTDKTEDIRRAGYEISDLLGPNFPTPGYEGNSFYLLKQMLVSYWDRDVANNKIYYQAPFDRYPLLVSFDPNGKIRDENQELLTAEVFKHAMDCMGNLYVAKNNPFTHSVFLGGAAIASAGAIYVVEGQPFYINAGSGHYFPSCEMLDQLGFLLEAAGTPFEEAFEAGTDPFCQAWYCNTITLSADFDGTTSYFGPIYELDDPTSLLDRRMFVPGKVSVVSGSRPTGSMVILTLDSTKVTLNYEIDPQNPLGYILSPGQNWTAGDELFYRELRLQVINGGAATGSVQVMVENCPDNIIPASASSSSRMANEEVRIFPNPVTGMMSIVFPAHQMNDPGPIEITLINTEGEIVLDQRFQKPGHGPIQIPTTHLIPGLYMARVSWGSNQFMQKIMVVK